MRIRDKKKTQERDRIGGAAKQGRINDGLNADLEAGDIGTDMKLSYSESKHRRDSNEDLRSDPDSVLNESLRPNKGSRSNDGSEPNKKSGLNAFKMKTLSETARSLPNTGKEAIKSDVLGSYTGTDMDFGSPVQDADDL